MAALNRMSGNFMQAVAKGTRVSNGQEPRGSAKGVGDDVKAVTLSDDQAVGAQVAFLDQSGESSTWQKLSNLLLKASRRKKLGRHEVERQITLFAEDLKSSYCAVLRLL